MIIRTDLALESENYTKATGELYGIKVTEERKEDINLIKMQVLNPTGERVIGKPMGTYITIEAPKLVEEDKDYHRDVSRIVAKELRGLILEAYRFKSKAPEVLVAGLGNASATPDSIGPKVTDNLLITRHLERERRNTFGIVSAISPGVMAQTGIETSEIIGAVIRRTEPDVLIVVDSLAARKTERLTSTIQICNTGIAPGSGVGNHRRAISEKTMGIPVIAIGIPTVVDAATLIHDAMEGGMEEDFFTDYKGMYVTTKDIDAIIHRISFTLSEAINMCMLEE